MLQVHRMWRDQSPVMARQLWILPPKRVQNFAANLTILIRRPTLFHKNEHRRNSPRSSAGASNVTEIADAETSEDFHSFYENWWVRINYTFILIYSLSVWTCSCRLEQVNHLTFKIFSRETSSIYVFLVIYVNVILLMLQMVSLTCLRVGRTGFVSLIMLLPMIWEEIRAIYLITSSVYVMFCIKCNWNHLRY